MIVDEFAQRFDMRLLDIDGCDGLEATAKRGEIDAGAGADFECVVEAVQGRGADRFGNNIPPRCV